MRFATMTGGLGFQCIPYHITKAQAITKRQERQAPRHQNNLICLLQEVHSAGIKGCAEYQETLHQI